MRYAAEPRRRATAASDGDAAAPAFAPLRIATYSGAGALDALSAAQQAFLVDELLPRTVADWAELLSVRPVDGSLALDRPCYLSYEDEDGCYGNLCHSASARARARPARVGDRAEALRAPR